MSNPINAAASYIKKVFSDLHNALVGAIVAAIILGGGGIYLFAQKLWLQLKNIAQLPTPLWATIALLSTSFLYTLVKNSKFPAKLNQKGQLTSEPPPTKIRYLTTSQYKWKVTVFNDGDFDLDEYPICVTHDLKFIFGSHSKYCPSPGCNNNLSDYDEFRVHETIKSLIERNIRTGEW